MKNAVKFVIGIVIDLAIAAGIFYGIYEGTDAGWAYCEGLGCLGACAYIALRRLVGIIFKR